MTIERYTYKRWSLLLVTLVVFSVAAAGFSAVGAALWSLEPWSVPAITWPVICLIVAALGFLGMTVLAAGQLLRCLNEEIRIDGETLIWRNRFGREVFRGAIEELQRIDRRTIGSRGAILCLAAFPKRTLVFTPDISHYLPFTWLSEVGRYREKSELEERLEHLVEAHRFRRKKALPPLRLESRLSPSEVLACLLHPLESLAWTGQPQRERSRAVLWKSLVLGFGLLALGILTGTAVFSLVQDASLRLGLGLFLLPVVVIAVYFGLGRLWVEEYLRRHTLYAVTNCRLLVATIVPGMSPSILYTGAIDENLRITKMNGSPGLQFICSPPLSMNDTWGVPVFSNLPDADRVARIIERQRRRMILSLH